MNRKPTPWQLFILMMADQSMPTQMPRAPAPRLPPRELEPEWPVPVSRPWPSTPEKPERRSPAREKRRKRNRAERAARRKNRGR